MKRVHLSSKTTGAPLSGAYEANGLVFMSGQIHADKEWNLQGETIEEKFEVIMLNIKRVLAEVDITLTDIVNIKLYLTDLSELPALNKVYSEHFKHPMPTRTAIGVTALPLGASLEIDVVASKK